MALFMRGWLGVDGLLGNLYVRMKPCFSFLVCLCLGGFNDLTMDVTGLEYFDHYSWLCFTNGFTLNIFEEASA